MKKIINLFDFYGKHISLYTKSSSKATTCVGFVFSIVSLLLLGLILYLECYDIFMREHPNVISYRQNIGKNNSTLSISNNTFNFFINIDKDFEMDNYLSHLHINSYIYFYREDLPTIHIPYEYCNDEDKSRFENHIEKFEFPKAGLNLCPRINYTETENIKSFSGLNIGFRIQEFTEENSDCIVDNDLNRKIKENKYNITAELVFIDSQIDLTNYEKPFWFQSNSVYSLSSWNYRAIIELDGSEINSQTLFSFNTPVVQSHFGFQRYFTLPKQDESLFVSLEMIFDSNNMYIYKRIYKTFNSAFATSFALFKLYNQIISIILSPIYTYYRNTIIINNNNFGYELLCLNNMPVSNNEYVKSKKDMSLGLTSVKTKKLTTFLALKNVGSMRYILCRRRNKIKTFYDQARYVIYRELSVENIFSYLIEYVKLKKVLLEKDSGMDFILGSSRKILLYNEEKYKAKPQLDELVEDTILLNNEG
jgi:hypothetical protein